MRSKNVMSLLGGAVAGAAAMYLLDPDLGQRRRKLVARQAGQHLGEVGEALDGGWDKFSRYASDIGHTAADKAHHLGAQLSDLVQDRGKNLWKKASNLGGEAQDRAREATRRMAGAHMGRERSPVIPVALTAIGCCAVGAGLMFIIDPRLGRSRRHWLIDQSRRLMRRTGNSFYRTGRHWTNRAYGVAEEARGAGAQLVARVQAAMRDILTDPRAVRVVADANGTVTLVGELVADEYARLLKNVESLPGVNLVINRLEIKRAAGAQERTANRPEGASRI